MNVRALAQMKENASTENEIVKIIENQMVLLELIENILEG